MAWVKRLALVVMLMFAATASAQQTGPRIALVIGNADYVVPAWKLANPVRDAELMANRLKALGFEVDLVRNATRAQMEAAFERFERRLIPAGRDAVSVVFYAGHGAEDDGVNYLVPVDADVRTRDQLKYRAPPAQLLLDTMAEARNRVNLLILDACRDMNLPASARSLTRGGLAQQPDVANVLIAYATAPGRTAPDGAGANSLFTGELAAALATQAHEPISLVFEDVQDRVRQKSGGVQEPSFTNRLGVARWSLAARPQTAALPAPAERSADANPPSPSGRGAEPNPPSPSGRGAEPDPPSPSGRGVGGEGNLATRPAPSPPTPLTKAEGERIVARAIERARQQENARRSQPPPPLTAGQTFRDCADCPEMVVIPAGSFVMGSPSGEANRGSDEGPQRTVSIRAFAAGKFEVTFDEWAACVAGGGCRSNANPGDEGWGRGRRPVINVSWTDAQEYVEWLSSKTGQHYRLLTEAEWEYVARGKFSGSANEPAFWWGAGIRPEQAHYNWTVPYNSPPTRPNHPTDTVTVGSFAANPFGLYNTHGNVWEWVQDCYLNTYLVAPIDGSAVESGDCSSRVYRGGSWRSGPQELRSANREIWSPIKRVNSIGFRLARVL